MDKTKAKAKRLYEIAILRAAIATEIAQLDAEEDGIAANAANAANVANVANATTTTNADHLTIARAFSTRYHGCCKIAN
jgi:hypothetical protein